MQFDFLFGGMRVELPRMSRIRHERQSPGESMFIRVHVFWSGSRCGPDGNEPATGHLSAVRRTSGRVHLRLVAIDLLHTRPF